MSTGSRFTLDPASGAASGAASSAAVRAVAAAFMRFRRGQRLMRGEWLAMDGSKFEAVSSRKAMLSRERLLKVQAARDALGTAALAT